jgi:hypothetical protein
MTTKQKVFAGVFLLAFVWVFLMGLLSSMAGTPSYAGGGGSSAGLPGGSRAPAKPSFTEDGSVKAKVTNLERDKFHLTLSLNVTDKDGRELGDVKEEEIVVYEDGTPVASKKFSPVSQSGLRVALAVDFGSYMQIGQDQRELMKVGTASLVKALNDGGDQFGLFVNNHHALQNNYREAVPIGPVDQSRRDQAFKRLDNLLQFYSGSGIYPTMGLALSKLAQTHGKRVLIVMSAARDDTVIAAEQAPTKEVQSEQQEKEKKAVADLIAGAKKDGIPIYMVYPLGTVKAKPEQEENMKRLGAESGGSYYEAVNAAKLTDYLVHDVIEKLRKDYTVEYESPNPVQDGLTRKVEVYVRQGSAGTKVDTSYHVPGVLATGDSQPKPAADASSSGTPVTPQRARPPIWGVLLPLGLILALLFAVPYLLMLRPRRGAETAAAPAPPPAAPVAQLVPSSTPMPKQAAAISPKPPTAPPKPVQPPPQAKPAKGSAPAIPVTPKKPAAPSVPPKPGRAGPEPKMW